MVGPNSQILLGKNKKALPKDIGWDKWPMSFFLNPFPDPALQQEPEPIGNGIEFPVPTDIAGTEFNSRISGIFCSLFPEKTGSSDKRLKSDPYPGHRRIW
jgi:hypothetical protein